MFMNSLGKLGLRRDHRSCWLAVLLAALLVVTLVGCAGRPASAGEAELPGLTDQAEFEATQIIKEAQATAMILKAHAQATALVGQASDSALPEPVKQEQVIAAVPTPELQGEEEAGSAALPSQPTKQPASPDKDAYTVQVVSVSYGADGTLIMVQFKATRKAVDDFWPGRLSVTDEATGNVYADVPVMPIIGPLIGRTKNLDEVGYVMFNNTAPGLPPGSLVTVKLGKYQQEHVPVMNSYQ